MSFSNELRQKFCSPCTVTSEEHEAPARKKTRGLEKQQTKLKAKASNLQKTLTDFSLSCCSKRCLLNQFRRSGDGDYLDFDEAKKCFDHYFNMYQFRDKEEYNFWIYEKFLGTCYGLDEAGKRIIHNFQLSYGTAQNQKTVNVCRDVWAFFLDVSEHKMRTLAECYKENFSVVGSTIKKNQYYSDKTSHSEFTIEDIRQIYNEYSIPYTTEMLQMGLVGRTEIETFVWFRDHFDLVGDPMPNTSDQVHIDKIEKQEIYVLYVNEVKRNCLTYTSWNKFWKKVFPNVHIRRWKNVSGKCDDCALINNGRLVSQSKEETKAFKRLHLLHKGGNFMLERLAYQDRRNKSKSDPSILSIIIDTMDNQHCAVPYLGTEASIGKAINQGILGCYSHGSNQLTIYRTTGNLS